jgi:predicted site-specific integrase-resolvase
VPARNGTYAPSSRRLATKSWGVWKEIASGAKQERAERKKVLALAQAPKVEVILVTELTSWGRSVLKVL